MSVWVYVCVCVCFQLRMGTEFEVFPGDSDGKESAFNAGDLDSISGLGKFPGEGHGNPHKYSCLDNSMDRTAWWATVHGMIKRWTELSN